MTTGPEKQKDKDEKEIARRRDEVLKRMLKTPPKPHSEISGDSKKKGKDEARKRQPKGSKAFGSNSHI